MRPVRICMSPNITRTLVPSSCAARAMPTNNGTSVPMSPKAPANSLRSNRIPLDRPATRLRDVSLLGGARVITYTDLYIQIIHVLGIPHDELAAGLDFVAHELVEELGGFD